MIKSGKLQSYQPIALSGHLWVERYKPRAGKSKVRLAHFPVSQVRPKSVNPSDKYLKYEYLLLDL